MIFFFFSSLPVLALLSVFIFIVLFFSLLLGCAVFFQIGGAEKLICAGTREIIHPIPWCDVITCHIYVLFFCFFQSCQSSAWFCTLPIYLAFNEWYRLKEFHQTTKMLEIIVVLKCEAKWLTATEGKLRDISNLLFVLVLTVTILDIYNKIKYIILGPFFNFQPDKLHSGNNIIGQSRVTGHVTCTWLHASWDSSPVFKLNLRDMAASSIWGSD